MNTKLFSLALLASSFASAQLYTPNGTVQTSSNNRVGIGTNTPEGSLDIRANGSIPIIRGNGGYIPAGLRFIDDSYTQAGQVREWSIWKGNTWAKGLGFMRYDVNACATGICDISLFLADNGNIGINTGSPQEKLSIHGKHVGSTILLNADNGGNAPANLTLWASEPDLTYTGVGIGNNVKNFANGQTFPRINTNTGGSYMRLLENQIYFNLISNTGENKLMATLVRDKFEVGGWLASQMSSNEGGALILENPTKIAPNTARKWVLYNMTGNYGNSLQFWNYSHDGKMYGSKLTLSDMGDMALYGKLEAKEVKVTNTPTADFVFAQDYDLPKLEDIEKHIKEKKHLPEIASAQTMEKEGVNVGEFQIKLLQKIEELTLYSIEQNKKLKSQSEQLSIQSKQLKQLQEENQILKLHSEEIKEVKERIQQLLSVKNK